MRYAIIRVVGTNKHVVVGQYGELKISEGFSLSGMMGEEMAQKQCAKANEYNNETDHGFIIGAEYYPEGYEVVYYNIVPE